eukprot:g1224.t1
MVKMLTSIALVVLCKILTSSATSIKNVGSEDAVYDLISRVFANVDDPQKAVAHFDLEIVSPTNSDGEDDTSYYFSICDTEDGRINIQGTTASELAAGLGKYLREYANMTIGWPRGGGSRVFVPDTWPSVGKDPLKVTRNVPWSYIMNVCTHSYSLVWYDWNAWQQFIDWMALSGVNLFLSLTGQELVQYNVFRSFGLSDKEIRGWFNGPAFLTWSRGQNEYGAGIAGPLPMSWMKSQWNLQRQILNRTRALGLSGQLPGFQGNVPAPLKDRLNDTNITIETAHHATGWMNSVDPMYAEIADVWMQNLVDDFGTDHWYQLDGYFDGGTAPWLAPLRGSIVDDEAPQTATIDDNDQPPPFDASWFARGEAAYAGLNRTDALAMWSYQGWAFVGWKSEEQASHLKAFIDATPRGKFVVIDMSTDGDGEWKMWNQSAFWDAKFVWTSLHDFGGTDGLKGDLSHANAIPFEGPPNTFGTGITPEGIDQNPVYYEFVLGSNFRDAPVDNIAQYVVDRSHRRYGLSSPNEHVTRAWNLLVNSSYSQDLSVQDGTAVPHIGPGESWAFENDGQTPSQRLCFVFDAWKELANSAADVMPGSEPFRYDLVNLGREVIGQLAGSFGKNFSDALSQQPLDGSRVQLTAEAYASVLEDIDGLVGTDPAFLLGSWIDMARRWGTSAESTDCVDTGYPIIDGDCEHFYEWNARVQLTTWNPTPANASAIPGGPIDYAAKHWNGLIKDYYAKRVRIIAEQGVRDASQGRALDTGAVDRIKAEHAYNWTVATNKYPSSPVGDFAASTAAMIRKYSPRFSGCP